MSNKSPFPELDFKWPNFDQGFWDRFSVPGIDTSALSLSVTPANDAPVAITDGVVSAPSNGPVLNTVGGFETLTGAPNPAFER